MLLANRLRLVRLQGCISLLVIVGLRVCAAGLGRQRLMLRLFGQSRVDLGLALIM